MSKKYNYPCLVLKKKSWDFEMVQFYVEASDIQRWCGVYRKEISEKGYQRILKARHSDEIKMYLDSNPKNVIPNSIVIAFNDKLEIKGKCGPGAILKDVKFEHPISPDGDVDDETEFGSGTLSVRVHPDCDIDGEIDEIAASLKRSAYVIDGQHRIAGGNASVEDAYFPVTAFLGVTKEDQAFHFIVINRKAQKVSIHDIDAVIPKEIYEELQDRLMYASIQNSDADIVYALDNHPSSPFCGKIKWANNPDGKAPINKGAIDKLIKYTRRLPDDLTEQFGNEYEMICAVWTGVNRHVDSLWDSDTYEKGPLEHFQNQFLKKAVAVIPAIQDAVNKISEVGMAINADGDDPAKALEESVYKWIKRVPLEFFYCEWIPTSITNDKRIKELSGNLVKAARRKKVPYGDDGQGWFEKPESIESKALKKEAEKKAKADARKAATAKKRAAAAAKKKAAAAKKKAAAVAKKKAAAERKKAAAKKKS